MIILQCRISNTFSISDASGIANIIIAACNLALAYYILFFQRNKENRKELQAQILQEQNIKLQWFKELIIQPHLSDINNFYNNLHTLESKIATNTLTEDEKFELIGFIKSEQSALRRTFVDILYGVNNKLHDAVLTNFDNLTDEITNTIFNDGFNLTHKPTYEKEIGSKINYSRNDLISKIYNYKGV